MPGTRFPASSRRVRGISAALVLALGATPAVAFKPTAEYGHYGIVRDSLTPITRNTTRGVALRFSERAILQIRDATAGVDEVVSARGEFTTPNAHCDDELLALCSQRIIDLKASVIAVLRSDRDGDRARAELGRALHTVEDFYSHSNWVNLSGSTANSTLGRSTLTALASSVQTCGIIFDGTLEGAGLTSLTSGYFPPTLMPVGKCLHGVLPFNGIHKDAPGRAMHSEARAAAVLGTTDFVNQILDGIAGDDAALRALMDVRPPVGFVIDHTGSMEPTISGVKSAVSSMVANLRLSDREPDQYVLVVFGDPDVDSPFVSNDGSALIARVNAISAGGGGDCPELAMAGLSRAVGAMDEGGTVFLFTDADPKDASLADNVVAAAQSKDIKIWVQQSGSCSSRGKGMYDQDLGLVGRQHALGKAVALRAAPLSADGYALVDGSKAVSPAYQRVTRASGGQLVSSANTSQAVTELFNVVEPAARGAFEAIALVEGQLGSAARNVTLPVDGTVSELLVSVSLGAAGTVNLRRPNGTTVAAGETGVTIVNLAAGRIFRIAAPTVGNWTAEISGSSGLAYSAQASGQTTVAITRFEFVEERGRDVHTGLFPISGSPVAGQAQTVVAGVQGSVSSVNFRLLSPAADPLLDLALVRGGGEVSSDVYSGQVTPPAATARFYISGQTSAGHAYQRLVGQTVLPQAVRVEPLQTSSDASVNVGSRFTARFRVTNTGASATFTFTAGNSMGATASVSPGSATLANGATSDVTVTVEVGLLREDSATLSLVASSAGTSNSALLVRPVINTLPRFPPQAGQVPGFMRAFGSTPIWRLDSSSSAEGPESLRSATISHSQSSSIEADVYLSGATFRFARRVSSESGFDYLRFYVDGVKRGEWSGEQAWALASYDISRGRHLLRWSYEKDGSVNSGSDAAWIDAMQFDTLFKDGFE